MSFIPINKTFLDEIESRLGNITEDNEYNLPLKKIRRARLKPFKPQDLPAANFWPSTMDNVVDKYGMDGRTISVTVEAHTKTRDHPFTDIADILAADIITALNRATTAPKPDDDPSYDLGGLVEDFVLSGYDYSIGEGQTPWCGVVISFEIRFSTEINKMFN
jgi:hypothetical protein